MKEVVVVEVVAVVIVAREKWYCKLNWMASAPSTQSARLHPLFPAALLHFSSARFVLPIRIEKTIYFYYYCCCQCKSKHTHTTRTIQQPDSISSTSTSSSSLTTAAHFSPALVAPKNIICMCGEQLSSSSSSSIAYLSMDIGARRESKRVWNAQMVIMSISRRREGRGGGNGSESLRTTTTKREREKTIDTAAQHRLPMLMINHRRRRRSSAAVVCKEKKTNQVLSCPEWWWWSDDSLLLQLGLSHRHRRRRRRRHRGYQPRRLSTLISVPACQANLLARSAINNH